MNCRSLASCKTKYPNHVFFLNIFCLNKAIRFVNAIMEQTSEIKHQVLGTLWERCDLFGSIFLCVDFHWNFATVQGCCFWLQGQWKLRVLESSLKSKSFIQWHSELNRIEKLAFKNTWNFTGRKSSHNQKWCCSALIKNSAKILNYDH